MNEKLIIKNFGAIKEAEIDIRKFMLFIGQQASGKSTIAKILAIFRDIAFVTEKENFIKYFAHYNIDHYFENGESEILYTTSEYTIEYKNKKFTITLEPLFDSKIQSELARIKKIIENAFASNPNQKKEEKDKLADAFFTERWGDLFSLLNKQVYIPAERILFSTIDYAPFSLVNLALPACLKEFGNQFDYARTILREHSINLLNVKYINDNGKNRIKIDDKHSFLLTETSSGFQALIPMIVTIDYLKNNQANIFIVEEPELNLFPSTQKKFIDYLVKIYTEKESNHGLIIATHSPYILSILSNSIFAYDVANRKPHLKEEVKKHLPEDLWINPDEFNVYFTSKGKVEQIFDRNTNSISVNQLDSISEDLNQVYEGIAYLEDDDDNKN